MKIEHVLNLIERFLIKNNISYIRKYNVADKFYTSFYFDELELDVTLDILELKKNSSYNFIHKKDSMTDNVVLNKFKTLYNEYNILNYSFYSIDVVNDEGSLKQNFTMFLYNLFGINRKNSKLSLKDDNFIFNKENLNVYNIRTFVPSNNNYTNILDLTLRKVKDILIKNPSIYNITFTLNNSNDSLLYWLFITFENLKVIDLLNSNQYVTDDKFNNKEKVTIINKYNYIIFENDYDNSLNYNFVVYDAGYTVINISRTDLLNY